MTVQIARRHAFPEWPQTWAWRLTAPPSCPGVAMRRIATIGVYGFTAGTFLDKIADSGVDLLLALLCVERDPGACHRSLVAGRLHAEHGMSVTDILPD